jgi:hypothetical protein
MLQITAIPRTCTIAGHQDAFVVLIAFAIFAGHQEVIVG